jgi:hypothetical protein
MAVRNEPELKNKPQRTPRRRRGRKEGNRNRNEKTERQKFSGKSSKKKRKKTAPLFMFKGQDAPVIRGTSQDAHSYIGLALLAFPA